MTPQNGIKQPVDFNSSSFSQKMRQRIFSEDINQCDSENSNSNSVSKKQDPKVVEIIEKEQSDTDLLMLLKPGSF